MTAARSFSPALFSFLDDLRANNEREWFQENKQRFDELVREPALAFVRDFEPALAALSPHFVADARPVGGSLFRIHRDTRFSRDKTPYKTHVGIQFRHERARDVHAPGFYLHLEPRKSMAVAGIWRPDGSALASIRAAIDADQEGWLRVAHGAPFTTRFELSGETLQRPPAGFPAGHALIADLKRKDFMGVARLNQRQITSSGFVDELAAVCRDAAPFTAFLCRALQLPF
jgi:uncharacterized protein (TIGR02453 family)